MITYSDTYFFAERMSTRILANRFELEKQLSQTDVSAVYLGCDRQQLQRPSCVITAIRYRQREMRHRLEREAQVIQQLGQAPQVPSVLAYFHLAAGQGVTAQEQSSPGGASRSHTMPPPEAHPDVSSTQPSASEPSPSQEHSTFYIVQDHVLGHPLSTEITPPKKLSESYVAKLLQDVLVALCNVHRHRQVHQNLHPQNLIRQDFDGQIFLTEFGGLSRLSRSEIGPDGKLHITVPVSPHPYLAPEQLQPDYAENPKPASDLYALGLIAIEALTGQPHYDLSYDPNKGLLWREGVNVSLPLAEFIDRLVRHQLDDRFADAAAALNTLRLGRDRYQVAHDSRLNTVIASPGRAANRSAPNRSQLSSGQTSFSTASKSYRLSNANPYLFKILTGSLAVLIALGVGVKTFQWGQYRLTQLPQTWGNWRAKSKYPEAKPGELTALLQDGSIQLRPAAASAFWEMVAAASADDVKLYALAGYQPQTVSEQTAGETARNDYMTGYAIAIGGTEESQDWRLDFAQSEAFQWLKANARDYGFELSVLEKGLLGSMSPEPWHWRYTGDEQSEKIFEGSGQ